MMIREFVWDRKKYSFIPVSEGADCFRLLISLYPEAAGIKNKSGKSPYDYAVHNEG
jgi:hypothetical protein